MFQPSTVLTALLRLSRSPSQTEGLLGQKEAAVLRPVSARSYNVSLAILGASAAFIKLSFVPDNLAAS